MSKRIDLTITVVWWQDGKAEGIPWKGYASSTAGLAVIRKPVLDLALLKEQTSTWTPARGAWQIIHRFTGMPVNFTTFPTRVVALAVAGALAPLADWTKNAGDICKATPGGQRALSDAIKQVYTDAGAELR